MKKQTVKQSTRLMTVALFAALLWAGLLSGCTLGIEQTIVEPPSSESQPTELVATVAPTIAAPTDQPAAGVLPWPDATPIPGGLVVDTSLPLGPISPYVYGSNYGPWVAVPVDYLEQAKTSGVTMLRYPGGEFGDRNDLSELQIDRFVAFARQMGAEPTINVRLRDGTPEQAAEMVRYANLEKGYGLTYWGIGNEPNLYPGDYTPEQQVTEWRAIAEAMRAVDPTIKLLGPEVSQYTGGSGPGPSDAHTFLDAFLAADGDLVDIVTIHRYPLGSLTGEQETVDELMASSAEWDQLIPDLRERIKRITGRDIPVGVTEINTHWTKDIGRDTTPDSYNNAIWLGDVIGRMVRQRVDIMTHFIFTTKDEQGGWGLIGNKGVRPSYFVYQLYQRFGQELRYAASGVEDVSLFAAEREDGALTLMAINRGPETAELPLTLVGRPGGTAEMYRLDPERVEAGTVNQPAGTAELGDGATVSLPPYTITLYILP